MKAGHSVTFTVKLGYHLPQEPAVSESHAVGTLKGAITRLAGQSINMVTVEDVSVETTGAAGPVKKK